MAKKINIIGAGVAGLCAGSYLQMNGYETEIFELHNVPGGLCTAWDRGGYRFDGCVHWLMGAAPVNSMYRMWNELMDMKNLPMVFSEDYFVMEDKNGKSLTIFRDVDKLEKELLEKAPEDKVEILRLTQAIRHLSKLNFANEKAPELMSLADAAKMIWSIFPYIKTYREFGSISLKEYSGKFKNPLLKRAIREGFVPEMSAIFLVFALADMHRKGSAYPVGGSLNLARLLEKRYLSLGGKIHYHARVKKITTTHVNGKDFAGGIELQHGEVVPADIVISAADGHYTIFEMLGGRFMDKTINDYFSDYLVFDSYLQVSLGVARTFKNEPTLLVLPLKETLRIDDQTTTDMVGFRIFNYDPTLAPEGKTAIVATLGTKNYRYWTELRKYDKEKYQAEKLRIARVLIDLLEKRLGNITENVEEVDVSSPATVIRYTNNWKGSFEGWVLTPKIGLKQMKKELPGLKNFYMVGQWISPGGGLPAGLITGRHVAQIICKKDKKAFVTQSF